MAYIILFLALAGWTLVALWGKPLRPYANIYFVGGLLGHGAEFVLAGLLRLYQYRSGFIADEFHDVRLMGFFVTLGIDPLFCVLYARYCRRHPVIAAVAFAALVAVLEVLFVRIGAMEYPVGWNPLYSFALSIPAFLLLWRLTIGAIGLPLWFTVDTLAFWAAQVLDVLLHGAFWLYHYESPWPLMADPRADSRIIAFLYSGLILAPVVATFTLRDWRRPWLAIALMSALFVGVESLELLTGLLVFNQWNLALSYLYYLWVFGIAYLYTRWLRKGKPV